jgi:hypothetical protein
MSPDPVLAGLAAESAWADHLAASVKTYVRGK